jgi:hypothetical protein
VQHAHPQGSAPCVRRSAAWGDAAVHELHDLRVRRGAAQCRSCLAALADAAPFEQSVAYEHLLLDLDGLYGDVVPPIEPLTGAESELLAGFEAGIDRLIDLGGDARTTHRLIDELIWMASCSTSSHGIRRCAQSVSCTAHS